MMKLSSNERKNKILHEVMTKQEISIQELAEKFAVTTETIRKDVSFLHEKKLLTKKHGAVTMTNAFIEDEFSVKENEHLSEKIKIAEAALTFIPENAAVLLDTSTNVLQLAKLLVTRNDLTIITNSLQISQVLAHTDNQVLLTGGRYRKKSCSYVGDWALNAINGLNVDVSFIGCDGFTATGPTIHSYQELEIKKAIVAHSKKTLLLCDTSKLKNEGLYTFAAYKELDMVITERTLTEAERTFFPEELLFFSNQET